jgi:3-oxoacyl-[acyl-carrier-protein] synthase-3
MRNQDSQNHGAGSAGSGKPEGEIRIAGTGSYLPERILTNAELEQIVDTSDEWITTRTGIRERHIAQSDEPTSHMAAAAAENALSMAGVSAEELDVIMVGTITPDMVFPNTGCLVQEQLGAKNAFCFDLEAACSGFLYGLDIARQFIATGRLQTALVIGADKLSCITDWEDRSTCVLFGDGAGAAVVRPAGDGKSSRLMGVEMASDGSLGDLLNMPGGGSLNPASVETVQNRLHYMKMTGNEVFKHAVLRMCDAARKALKKSGLSVDDIDWVIPHQANMRIIKAISNRLKVPLDRFCNNLDRVGNTSAASIPIAMDEAVRDGRVRRGDKLLFIAFGGGFTWGAGVMEF